MEDIKLKITQAFGDRALIGSEGHYSIADVWGESVSGIKDPNAVARRIVASWNACEGLETELLETLPLNFKAHALQCAGLREENASLRAAVAEMQRMLLPLERLETGLSETFKAVFIGTGLESLDHYRQTLETALAKIEENK